jgi:hypothetical protein
MLRAVILALSFLHLGPGIAFAVLAFGCDGATPTLGDWCGKASIASFGKITVLAWLILGVGYGIWYLLARRAQTHTPVQGSEPKT